MKQTPNHPWRGASKERREEILRERKLERLRGMMEVELSAPNYNASAANNTGHRLPSLDYYDNRRDKP